MIADEIRAEKARVEHEITKLLAEFYANTGCRIDDILIKRLDLGNANYDGGRYRPDPIYEARCFVSL
jgi:hypothetical protein